MPLNQMLDGVEEQLAAVSAAMVAMDPATLEQSMTAARIGGHISVIGILTGLGGEISIVSALIKQLRLQGVLVGNRTQQQEMIKAINANNMRPVIDKVFALENIVGAFRYQETNQHFGKICLEM